MLATAAGFAVLAAISPAALLVCAVYLGSASPRRSTLLFLCGAITMTLIMGIVVLVALRASGLSLPSQHTPRYGVRLGLGVLALGGGVFMARRGSRHLGADMAASQSGAASQDKAGQQDAGKGKKKPGLMSRMMTKPGPLAAFLTGIIVFIPSAAFVAAVQVIATAQTSAATTVLTLAVVIAIDVVLVWLPFLLYLAAPDATARRLRSFNGWLRRHGHAMVAGALMIAGLLLVVDGITGLT